MPTYEYVCKKCAESLEVFQSFSERPLRKHKACGGELQKVFHARGIVFKGDGFYATDRKSSKTSKTPSESSKDKSSEKSPEKSAARSSASTSSD